MNFLKNCSHANIVSYVGCYFKNGQLKNEQYIWVRHEYIALQVIINIIRLQWNFVQVAQLKRLIKVSLSGTESCKTQVILLVLKANLSENEISLVLKEALEGLAFLHSRRQIHRDIKAGNILLTKEARVKLADFGVSTQLTKTLSKRNTFIGTPYWYKNKII